MATIQRIARLNKVVYRAIIRKKSKKTISRTFSAKKLAVQFIRNVEADRKLRYSLEFEVSNKIRLSELTAEYLKSHYKGKDLVEQTRKLSIWASHLNNPKISAITVEGVESGLSVLSNKLSNASINRHKASLSGVLTFAQRKYGLPTNPARHTPALPENNARTRFLSESERALLLKACRHSEWPKLYLLVLLAITTGARKGELLNLKWSDINLERCTAHVATTKNGQPKVLPLTLNVIKEINRFADSEYSLIFHSKIKPEQPFRFYKTWKKVLKEADIKDFRFHDLRHTTASYLAQSGATLLEIADVLGHKQISVTQRYAHLCIEHKSKLINEVMSGL